MTSQERIISPVKTPEASGSECHPRPMDGETVSVTTFGKKKTNPLSEVKRSERERAFKLWGSRRTPKENKGP